MAFQLALICPQWTSMSSSPMILLSSQGGFPACPKQAINLIMEDGKRSDATEVSWFRNTRTSQYCVRLNLPFLIQCFQSAKYFPCPAIVLLAKSSLTHGRPQRVVYSGHTWWEALPIPTSRKHPVAVKDHYLACSGMCPHRL